MNPDHVGPLGSSSTEHHDTQNYTQLGGYDEQSEIISEIHGKQTILHLGAQLCGHQPWTQDLPIKSTLKEPIIQIQS